VRLAAGCHHGPFGVKKGVRAGGGSPAGRPVVRPGPGQRRRGLAVGHDLGQLLPGFPAAGCGQARARRARYRGGSGSGRRASSPEAAGRGKRLKMGCASGVFGPGDVADSPAAVLRVGRGCCRVDGAVVPVLTGPMVPSTRLGVGRRWRRCRPRIAARLRPPSCLRRRLARSGASEGRLGIACSSRGSSLRVRWWSGRVPGGTPHTWKRNRGTVPGEARRRAPA
jgi:hypothetical protein